MSRKARIRRMSVFCGCSLLLLIACERPKQQATAGPDPVPPGEHAAHSSPVGTNQSVLQKTFVLTTSTSFPFQIPAHAVRPHLQGTFESFSGDVRGRTDDSGSDDSANLDFLVLNREQYEEFSHGHSGEALFSVEGSHNQAINYDLPASLDQPVKYYLVFRSSSGSGPKKVVEAKFRVDF